jgi:UDP:flavonoid glycosyltransferase YjiC (YdhE family)
MSAGAGARNAAAVAAWGAGLALPGDARRCADSGRRHRDLASPSYRAVAARLAVEFNGVDGAERAADEIEAMLPRSEQDARPQGQDSGSPRRSYGTLRP